MKKTIALLSVLTVSTVISTRADILAQWTFETTPPAATPGAGNWYTNIVADVGNGVASGLHATAATFDNPAGNGSLESFSANNWSVGDFYQFAVSTVGYTGIGVSYDHISSNTGPGLFDFAYSTDGVNFTTHISSYTVLANATPDNWTSGTYKPSSSYFVDLSSITALDNETSVYFRLVNSSTTSANGLTVATGGTSRVDNFTVLSPVPEPSTAVLAILGGLLGFAFLRRKR